MKKVLIKDLFNIRKGRKETETDSAGIRYIQIEDLRNDDNLKFCEENDKNILINENDIIIAWDGANAGIVDFGLEGALGSTLGRLRLKEEIDSDLVNTHYVGFFLKSKENYIKDNTTGATIPHVSRTVLQNIEIDLPSVSRQNKIVEMLNKIVKTMSLRQQQIEALSELKQSVFYEMFGTYNNNTHNLQKAKLGEFATLVTSGSTPRGGAKSYLDEGIPLIRSQNVLWNKFDLEDVAHISDDTHKSMKRSQLKNRDVLLNITGASIGRSVVFSKEDYSANVNQHVCIIRLNNKINPYFLTYYFSSDEFQSNVVNKNVGATRQAFNYTQIKNFNILVPNVEFQNKFEDTVKEIDRQINLLSISLKQMHTLYNSILHKAFNGEIFKEKTNA